MAKKTARAGKPPRDGFPKPAATRPRQGRLPGAEGVRIGELDDICSEIGGIVDEQSSLRQNLENQKSAGIKALKKAGRTTYKFQGVTVTLVPGDVKLSVRKSKQGGENADDEDEEVGDDQNELDIDVDPNAQQH